MASDARLLPSATVNVLVQHTRNERLIREAFFGRLLLKPREIALRHADVHALVLALQGLAGIQAAMTQDLDVLLVGDVTSVEELQACMTVAETGHLVLTQIHADSPEGAIRRMLDVFPDELRPTAHKTLAAELRAVCAQRLFPRADGRGRVAAYGVLIPDSEMRAAIASGADFTARKTPWPEGRQTMAEHIARLLEAQVISSEGNWVA